MPDQIEVSVDVPFMQFIYNVYPISFIIIVGFAIGVLACFFLRYRHQKYNDRRIRSLIEIYNRENNVAE